MTARKLIIGALLMLLPVLGFCQLPQRADSIFYPGGASNMALLLAFSENQEAEAALLAERDIAAGRLFLILKSGIAPVVYSSDSVFEKKFRVTYWEEGCSGPNYACMQAYNSRMFTHLTSLYGKAWRRTVRRDVVGYKQWRKASK
ncbi:hypothetical protein [Solirubrum puertoriconensis]|uniref:Uncharacterized protein n=1 Tax=Solirubrum puertoriconensis TaxID=1751427 RepID=A0A9X0HJ08_SOLP1|nr:hypothetical protein [Solirubrum puertoriconensis]KUG06714.1 hypothetical protein ASU33_05085 [Solirubrum puertoriconensis]